MVSVLHWLNGGGGHAWGVMLRAGMACQRMDGVDRIKAACFV